MNQRIRFRDFGWDEDAKRGRTRYMVLYGSTQPGQVLRIHDDKQYPWRGTRFGDGAAVVKFRTRAEAAMWVVTGKYASEVTA